MSDRELMQQALEALDGVLCDPLGKCCIDGSDADRQIVDSALDALRERLSQTEQEPRQWQRLTDEEREQFRQWAHPEIIEAIELRLQERNT